MKHIKVKVVDYFNIMEKKIIGILEKRYEVEISDKPDFLFYGPYGTGREHYKYPESIKVCWCSEGVVPDFNECDYAIGSFPMTVCENRYFRVPYVAPNPILKSSREVNKSLLNRKFCNFLYSNPNQGQGAILRREFCKELMKYKHVDCPGWVLNNMDNIVGERNSSDWRHAKIDFMRNYKFTISFENTRQIGMTSEKLSDPFISQSVPIYWGDTEANKIYRQEAYIDCNTMNSIHEMVEKVIEIDQNDELYLAMLSERAVREDFDWEWEKARNEFIYNIIEDGTRMEKDPLGWDSGCKAVKLVEEIEHTVWFKMHVAKNNLKNRLERKLASKK